MFHLTRSDFVRTPATNFDAAIAKAADPGTKPEVAKAGARNNKQDAADIQDMHDKCMKMAGGAHCAGKGGDEELAKAGARHSAGDLAKIKEAHDIMCALGATCG